MNTVMILAVASLFAMGGTGTVLAEKRVVIPGTGDSQRLLRVLAEAFEGSSNPGTRVEIPESIGSSGGVRAVANGRCELARVARPLLKMEAPHHLNYRVFAYSPVVFAASADVKGVTNLTREQIVGIYSGTISSWSALGGAESKIRIADREPGDSSRSVLEAQIEGFKDISTRAGKILYSTPEALAAIVTHQKVLGYVPLSVATGTALVIMQVDGVYPSLDNVQTGKYGLVVPFGFVWKGDLSDGAQAFIDFVLGPEGRRIISESGAVPVAVRE